MGKTVLLLDDDPYFRRQLTPVLEERGYTVVEAGRASLASRKLAESRLDAAIVDGLLPDTSGMEWIAELRAGGSEIPVVFVSAFYRDLRSYKRLTQELGVAKVLYKPLAPDALADVLTGLIGPAERPIRRVHDSDSDVFYVPPDVMTELLPDSEPPRSLEQMRRSYVEVLPAIVQRLVQAARRARTAPADIDLLRDLRRQAHEVRGTAGSYGMHEVGKAAGRIEDAVIALSDGASPDYAAWDRVVRALDVMRSEVSEAFEQEEEVGGDESAAVVIARVLVVDDDPVFTEHLAVEAKGRLLEVLTAETVEDAVAVAEKSKPDLALVGWPLGHPDRSAELLTRLRAKSSSIVLGVVSLEDTIWARLNATQAGATLFLSHPVEGDALEEAVRGLLAASDNRGLRVAFVSEDQRLIDQMEETLRRAEMTVEALDTPKTLIASLLRFGPDAIVLDSSIGDISATDLCRTLRASPRFVRTPIFLMDGTMTERARLAALHARADDTLRKGEPGTWARIVSARVQQAHRTLAVMDRDPATGLAPRHLVLPQLHARLSEAKRRRQPFTVALLRIDAAELLREHGRLGAERALSGLGRLVRARLRLEDLRGRWGSHEVVLGLSGADADGAASIIERMRDEYEQMPFSGGSGSEFRAGFDIGIASFPEDGQTIEALVRRAAHRSSRPGG
jgi:diguanylate cyclase (GGDEF)-like protein